MYIDIEPQTYRTKYHIENRGLAYGCRLISRQFAETSDDKFDYDSIRKSYSVWICPSPVKEAYDSINYYGFNEHNIKGSYHTAADYKLVNVIFLNLGKNYKYESKGILEMLSLLLTNTKLEPKLVSEKLLNDYGIIRKEQEVIEMGSYADALKGSAFDEGVEFGFYKGIEEKAISVIFELNKRGTPLDIAFDITKADERIQKKVIQMLNDK